MTDNDLHASEWELLTKHIEFYRKLETGERTPTTDAQVHFVEVCEGRAEPRTEHEIAYVKYKRGANATVQYAEPTTPVRSGTEQKTADETGTPTPKPSRDHRKSLIDTERTDSIPEYEEGYPNPNWYPGRDRSRLNPYSRRPRKY